MNVKRSLAPFVSLAVAASLGAACGESRDSSRPVTAGEELARSSGCTACHGSNGEGGVGPAWQGLAGSEVKLSDGSTVVADDAYIAESIADPAAKSRPGYGAMPANSLDDAEIAQIVEFIKSLEK